MAFLDSAFGKDENDNSKDEDDKGKATSMSILMVEKNGKVQQQDSEYLCSVNAGELVTKRDDTHEYHLIKHPDIVLQDVIESKDVIELSDNAAECLLPVKPPSIRLKQFHRQDYDEILKLKIGDGVSVLLDQDGATDMACGFISNIKDTPGRGKFFGISFKDEFKMRNDENRYSLYVSMEKILQRTRFPTAKQSEPDIRIIPLQSKKYFSLSLPRQRNIDRFPIKRTSTFSSSHRVSDIFPPFRQEPKVTPDNIHEDLFTLDLSPGPSEADLTIKELQEKVKVSVGKNAVVSHKDVKLPDEDDEENEIGKGAWGRVVKGKYRGDDVAVKIIHSSIKSDYNRELIYHEIEIMSQLHHPKLLLFIGAVLDHPLGYPMIITEVMDTSLRKAYENKKLTPSCRPVILSIMRDVAVALNYLHCLPDPIIHRDVSSANVLLESKGNKEWKAKLGDFGSAKLEKIATSLNPGALAYSAPESLTSITCDSKQQTIKMDVFSYGVLYCEALTCIFPSDHETFKQMKSSLDTQHRKLIEICTEDEPRNRPAMNEITERLCVIMKTCTTALPH